MFLRRKLLVILIGLVTLIQLSLCVAEDQEKREVKIESIKADSISNDEEGNLLFPVNGDTLKVNYVGQFLDGIEFDRNGTGQPFEFILGTGLVIEGWDIGLKYIDEEGTGILIVPSGLGYGNTVSGSIPPNSVLVFRVSLLDIK